MAERAGRLRRDCPRTRATLVHPAASIDFPSGLPFTSTPFGARRFVRSLPVKIELFDGATGSLAGTKENLSLTANQWTQYGSILSEAAPSSSNAWVRITRTSGSAPFLAYAVLNDGGRPGLRSGDGAFVWAVLECAFTVPSGRTLGWSGGTTSPSKPIGLTVAANEVTSFSLSATVGQRSISGSFTAENSPRPVVQDGKRTATRP